MATNAKHKLVKINKAAEPLFGRSAVFLLIFIFTSGILGPHIMQKDLFYRYGFQYYGEAGKALLFGFIAFLLLIGHKKAYPSLPKWRWLNLLWLAVAIAASLAEWAIIDRLAQSKPGVLPILEAHVLIVCVMVSALLSSFGMDGIKTVWRTYKRELVISTLLWVGFDLFLNAVYGLWSVLSTVVLVSVKVIFGLIGISAIFIPPHSLLFSKFVISVAEGCSGIESIALFTALYALIGIIDFQRFNHRKYVAVFAPALVLLFGFNILRVFVLILAGYYINPQIAFTLFHTYAGMVFFILYSALFWGISYQWMLRNETLPSLNDKLTKN